MTAVPATVPERAPLKLRRDDFYPTPPSAVRALLAVEALPQPPARIWEPFAGRGAIVDVLVAADCPQNEKCALRLEGSNGKKGGSAKDLAQSRRCHTAVSAPRMREAVVPHWR